MFNKPKDAPEEHTIALPGLSIAFNHTLKIVFVVDQTGTQDLTSLKKLEDHLNQLGYFMHCVVVGDKG